MLAFVRFAQLQEVELVIKNLHDLEIRGKKILVKIANYKRYEGKNDDTRREQPKVQHGGGEWNARRTMDGGSSYKDVVLRKSN